MIGISSVNGGIYLQIFIQTNKQLGSFGKLLKLMKNVKTKKKKISEANDHEWETEVTHYLRTTEIDEFLRTEYASRAKARKLIEEYLESRKVPPGNQLERKASEDLED